MRYLRLLGYFLRAELQFEMAYLVNMLIDVFQVFVIMITSLTAIWVLFAYTTTLNGWTEGELMALLGVYYMMQGFVNAIFGPSTQRLMEHVRLGTLDFILLKPVDSQFMVSVRHSRLMWGSQSFMGVGLLILGALRTEQFISIWAVLGFAVTFGCGVLLVYALLLVLSTSVFWFVKVDNMMAIFWGFLEAGRFPLDTYPGWLQLTLSTVVPIGVAVTLPASALVGRLDLVGGLVMVAGTALAMAFAAWFWRLGLRSYTGASA